MDWPMSDRAAAISEHLSQNMFQLRQARNLSQSALASLSGLPRSTVTHIESGAGNPSLRSLIKVASALHVSVEELLARPRSEVHRVTQLLPDPIPGMSIERVEMEVGARLTGAPHVPNSKEYITLIAGGLEISVAGQTHRLAAGDVLAYPGDQPHRYGNAGRGRATFLSVVVVAPLGM
jgi:transcriptional regulator with XRE-family HTH domain